MFIVAYRKIFFTIGALLVALSVFFVIYDGLNLSIEFTGGSVVTISYPEIEPVREQIETAISEVVVDTATIRSVGENGYSIRTRFLEDSERVLLLEALRFGGEFVVIEENFSSVGPSVGAELVKKTFVAIGLASIAIVLFVAFAFRGISKPISSWWYGGIAIIALVHDVLIPTGLFAFLGVVVGAQIDVLFVTALLAILGYSVNDTIIVFDRIREKLKYNEDKKIKQSLEEVVGKSLQQTYARSINTSLTTSLALLALYFFGGQTTQYFALVLLVGVIAGTYSSIFLAGPLLVTVEKVLRKRK